MLKHAIILAPLLLLAGCAKYSLTPISREAADNAHNGGNDEGYIFHAPAPFLIGTLKSVTSSADGKKVGEYEYSIEYLPDYDRPYRFTRFEVFAKSDLKITFDQGWKFTGAESSTDSTAALAALAQLAGAFSPAANAQPEEKVRDVVMFRIRQSYGKESNAPFWLEPVTSWLPGGFSANPKKADESGKTPPEQPAPAR